VRRVRAEILSTRRYGAYRSITLVAPDIAERARPGQFLTVQMPEDRDYLLPRHFPIHQASRRGGWAGTLEFCFEPSGKGTTWLANAKTHGFLDVIGPLGRAFAYPKRLTTCLLVAEGRGAAPIYFLAQELLARGRRVDMVIGADAHDAVLKPIEAKRLSQSVAIVTRDGSVGERGEVMDAVPEMAARCGSEVVYACASTPVLRAIAAFCRDRRTPAQVAVEERMGCGVGLCGSCVVPIARKDGTGFDQLRACVEGPVFDPARIEWDRWGAIDGDAIPESPALGATWRA